MKKVLSMVLAVMMLLAAVCCFAGCGEEEKGVLKMATNAYFPPYEFYEGEPSSVLTLKSPRQLPTSSV